MWRKRDCIIIITTVLLIFLGGCRHDNVMEEERKVAVEVSTVKRGNIAEEITISSRLQPIKNIMIFPKTPGLEVTKLTVDVGDTVQEGDFLFELDKTPIRRQVEAARKAYGQAQKNYRIQKQEMEAVKPIIPTVPVGFWGVQETPSPMDNRLMDTSLVALEGQLEQARLAYITALEQLDEMEYYAPIDGVVTQTNLQENQMVIQTQPAMVISNTNLLKLELYVVKELLNSLKIGQEVAIDVAEDKNIGSVTMISKVPDPRTNLYYIQINVDNGDGRLLAGSFCRVIIERQRRDNTLLIPKEAIVFEDNTPIIFIEENQRPVKRQIELGIDGGKMVEVVKGIGEGDRVIVKGQHYIDENTLLTVVRSDNHENF
ncbi:efflux RND transporter periplasmic adaptor subunit [Natronincola ferrireducens]|uniref:RND family efflux transporter, MFP subunit n=1 Tax=Natronincola ferrireducens TaxID=393762 RepID=A0A1G9DZI7_9FIRM|nr:efflux RND transporter periplasmic adaptor subunit [Natronincola ferrireducens]SDK69228.1 RND family efflux transporter, MFP subunit [Natronincola ferrireducens]